MAGLSLGGMTAYHLALRHPSWFKGALLLAPALMPSIQHASFFGVLKNTVKVARWLLPTNTRVVSADYDNMCRYSKCVDLLRNDKLSFRGKFKIQTIATFIDAENSGHSTFEDFSSPFMVVMGGCDKIIDPHVAFELFTKSKTAEEDKEILFS